MKSFPPLILLVSLVFISSCGISGGIFTRGEPPTAPEGSSTEIEPVSSDTSEKTELSGNEGEKIEDGEASWYGPNFHGKLTANGETYDMDGMTAAHRTLPFDTVVRVENVDNGKTVDVRINDRGPFAKDRIIDLSRRAAKEIDMIDSGTAEVELYLIEGDLENSRTKDLKNASFTVQLGSFATRDSAEEHASKINGSRVEVLKIKEQDVFRVYFGTYSDEKAAREAYEELERKGHPGYIKQIEN